ncbi:MAG: hypothetical protein AMJ54_09140 [Deltaproteobacteria bacterium SG8_13]|nr:MAG: hypothetical protein AMJ54_09140 [Deltaproteobacteria bacterium SG8_13]
MTRSPDNGLSFFQFDQMLEHPQLRHAVFTRRNGCSSPPFSSLNTSFGVGDDPEHVKRNRQAIQSSLKARQMVFARQVHGVDVQVITSEKSENPMQADSVPSVVDAMATNLRHRFLTVQVADCQPVLLYDPHRKAVANVHAGWRGSIRNIVGRTVQAMQEAFQSDPGDIIAGVGPSLGPCCAEFRHYRREIPQRFWRYKDGDHHFDFWAISRDQLVAAGVGSENIQVSGICTRCHPELFFSYRGEGITGRFAAVIGLT